MRLALALLAVLLAASCERAALTPHYVLGTPYYAGGVWYYPRESYEYSETGLAMVYPPGHAKLTTDGEEFDQTALAAAHQTLQLPVIARLTNLENGRQVLVRVNDRGPATPHRLIEVTARTATLLGFPSDGVARIRLDVVPAVSEAAVDSVPGVPKLKLVAAPVGEVQQTNLPPPGSAAPAGPSVPQRVSAPQPKVAAPPPLRLAETVTEVAPDPGRLFVRLDTFQNFEYANIQRARVARLGADIVVRSEGGARQFQVIVGPFTTVAQADAALDQVLRAGVTDAQIVVE